MQSGRYVIRGVTFKGNREDEIQKFPDPHAGPGDAVLRVRASGLCGSDLHRYRAGEPTMNSGRAATLDFKAKLPTGPGGTLPHRGEESSSTGLGRTLLPGSNMENINPEGRYDRPRCPS